LGNRAHPISLNGTTVPAPADIHSGLYTSQDSRAFGFLGEVTAEHDQNIREMVKLHKDILDNVKNYTNLSNIDCYNAYHQLFVWRPHVVLVSGDSVTALERNSSLLRWGVQRPTIDYAWLPTWLWTAEVKGESFVDETDHWPGNDTKVWDSIGFEVQYCLSNPHQDGQEYFSACHLQCAPQILLGIHDSPESSTTAC
jgi:hypothetical protein